MRNPNAIVASDYGPIIINTHDSVIARQIIAQGYWAGEDINLIKQLIGQQLQQRAHVTFYDVGANIGTHTLALAKSFAGRIKVRAFEAQRMVYHMLCGTVAINGLENVWCHHHAVGDVDGAPLEIGLLDYHHHNNFGALELRPPQHSDQQEAVKVRTETVRTITLDSFDEPVDFLKIDVEGMEDAVLRGAARAIGQHRPMVFVEVHKTDALFVQQFFQSQLNYTAFLRGIDLILIPLEWNLQVNGAQRVF